MVRIKHRYLLLNILYPELPATRGQNLTVPESLKFHSPSPNHFNAPFLLSHLRHCISNLFGDCGLGLAAGSLKVVYISPATSTAIIRCPRQHFRVVWAALTFMNELPGSKRGDMNTRCVIQVVRVSGTIRKSEEELVRRARREVVRAKGMQDGQNIGILDHMLGQDLHSAKSVQAGDLASDTNSVDDKDSGTEDDD